MTNEQLNENETLGDALPREIERVQELIKVYDANPMGFITAQFMRNDIRKAHSAMMNGDVIEMLRVYESLKGWEL